MEKNESPYKNPRNKNPMTSGSSPAKADTPESFASMQGIPVIYGTFIAQQQISGPIPSPDVLRQYEAMSPGAADRLLRLAEQEAEHRRKMEMEIILLQGRDQSSYRRSEFWGQIFGFAIGAITVIGAVFSAVHGAQIAASFIGTSGVVGLVSTFIWGRNHFLRQKKQEFDQEMQVMAQRTDQSKAER